MSRRSPAPSSASPQKLNNRYSSVDMIQHHRSHGNPGVIGEDDDVIEEETMVPLATGGATTTFSGKRRVSLLDSKELEVLQSLLGKSSGIALDPEKLKPQKVKVSFSNLTPRCFNEQDNEGNISFNKKEGVDHHEVFGATPVKLVEKMTLEGFLDSEFLTDFLQSFRSFMDPIDLLHILLLRLQWTQDADETIAPTQERELIQNRTLATLKFWTEQHVPDFQNVELASKIRFHFKLMAAPMLSAENAVLFEELHNTFGVKGKKKVSNVTGARSKGFEGFSMQTSMNLPTIGAKPQPAMFSPEEAKVEKVNKQNRPRSSTSRWVSSPFKREPKESPVATSAQQHKGSFLTMNSAQASAFLASASSPAATTGSSATTNGTTHSSPSSTNSSPSSTLKATHLAPPTGSPMNPNTPPASPRKSSGDSEGEQHHTSPRRSSRAQSISQKVARLGHETKRKVGNLVGSKDALDGFNKSLLEQKSSVLAQQLCLIEQRLHRELAIKELTELGWTKKKKGNEARVVMAIINRFNEFSRWVAYAILKGSSHDQRAKIIEKFIRICDKCMLENNLSTVMQIDLALQRQEVFNLKKTWHHVGSYEKDMLRRIREFTTPVRNFKKVRELMESIQGIPAVPFLGLYLSDMVFNAELPNTTTSEQMINVNKFRNKGNIVRRALKFVSLPSYPFEDDLRLQGKLTLLPFSTEVELEKLAKGID